MKPFAVVFREYERGWGSKDFHAVFYDTYVEAEKVADTENAKNNASIVPDYYIQARVEVVTPRNQSWLENLAK